MKHTILKVRCAWHLKNFGFELEMGTKDGHGVEGTTDGICPACYKITMKGVKAMAKRFNQDPEVEQARAKAKEAFEYGKAFLKTDDILEKTAEHFQGEVHHTGGGVMVTLFKAGKHFVVGITDECVVLYWNPSSEDLYEIFWNGNDEEVESLDYTEADYR